MNKAIFTKRNIIFTISTIMLFGLIGFAEKKTSEKSVNNVLINIKDAYGSHFVNENDIMKIITMNHSVSMHGKGYHEVDLKFLEKRIQSNKFVRHVEVYKDHKGNLLIDVDQRRPIARIIPDNHPHAYIGDEGSIIPVSEKFTARVVLIDGAKASRFLDSAYRSSEEAKTFNAFLHMIDRDPFLKAQISQITFKSNGELELRPQIGNELILFGKMDDLEVKLNKFKIYYKKIIQLKGFNKYKVVNLKYKEQIICE